MDALPVHPLYFDYNATTPIDARVLEAMRPYFHEDFGNPSSAHLYGQRARDAVCEARAQVAQLLKATPDEIVFTGGGSESDNLAIKGVVFSRLDEHPHIVTSTTEHPAVINTLTYLKQRFGIDFTLVPVDEYGRLDPASVSAAIRPSTVLVTVMHANNEVGTIQPLAEIGRVAQEVGVLFHVDAAQSAGKVAIDVRDVPVDLLTLAGHKLYGPKGVGVLYVRRGVRLDPLIHGSSQEAGRRAGTENVASIVGLGAAAQLAEEMLNQHMPQIRTMRDNLFEMLTQRIPCIQLNGHPKCRVPNTLNVSFPGVPGQAVLDNCPDVAASTGAACHSQSAEPSSVLSAMGMDRERALGAVRLSLGRWTTDDGVRRAADALTQSYASLLSFA